MTFKSRTWFPIAVVLAVANVVATGFAAAGAEPVHASTHAALAVAFAVWAQYLRRRIAGGESEAQIDVLDAVDRLDAEVNKLRLEVGEMQERLDFAERLLAKGRDAPRVDPHQ